MSKVSTTEEGANALKKMSQGLLDNIETIQNATQALQGAYDENAEYLGVHADSIGSVIENVRETSSEAVEPVSGLSDAVLEVADDIMDYIANDPLKSNSGN